MVVAHGTSPLALFDLGAKAVRLIEAGRVFLTGARAVLQRTSEAVQTVKAVATGQQGELHVGYVPSLMKNEGMVYVYRK